MVEATAPQLSWHRADWEERCGFRGGRYTNVGTLASGIAAVLLTAATYGLLLAAADTRLADMLRERGPTPYFIVLLSWWSLVILFLKRQKIALQARALQYDVTPDAADFALSSATVNDVVRNIYRAADDPQQFLVFRRILTTLSNLRNIGRIADVDEMLRSQADQDEAAMETSYVVVQGFIWGIPVLGFIGTVLGLSDAISAFGEVLGSSSEMSQITGALRNVTAGLNTAFDTTLEALVAAIVIQFLLTFVRKGEEDFLSRCSEYGMRQVVAKLRVTPYETETVDE